MTDWARTLALTGAIAAAGCGGSDGKDCDRYAAVTCEKACACSPDPTCVVVWGPRVYDIESRTECERTLGDICRGETVEGRSCTGATYLHPLCPLGGVDAGPDPNAPAILELNAPERSPLDTVAIRGRAANATRVAVQVEDGETKLGALTPGGDFCVDMLLPTGALTTFAVYALDDTSAVSTPSAVDVGHDAEAPEPPEPTCSGECAGEENCGNDFDDDCNALADGCDPACNGCPDDSREPNDVPFSVPALDDGTYTLDICPCREDWFAFELAEGDEISAGADFDNDEIDIDLQIFRAEDAELGLDNPLASSITTSDNEQVSYTAGGAGSYYLRVYSIQAGASGSYQLHVTAGP